MKNLQPLQKTQQIIIKNKEKQLFYNIKQSIFAKSKVSIQNQLFTRISSTSQSTNFELIQRFNIVNPGVYRHRIAYFLFLYLLFEKYYEDSHIILQKLKSFILQQNFIIQNCLNNIPKKTSQILNQSNIRKKKLLQYMNFMDKYKKQINFYKQINQIPQLDQILINFVASSINQPLNSDPIQKFLQLNNFNVSIKNFDQFCVKNVQVKIISNQIFQIIQKKIGKQSISTDDKTAIKSKNIPELNLKEIQNKNSSLKLLQNFNVKKQINKSHMKSSIIDGLEQFMEKQSNKMRLPFTINDEQDDANLGFYEKIKKKNIQFVETDRLFGTQQQLNLKQIKLYHPKTIICHTNSSLNLLKAPVTIKEVQNPEMRKTNSQIFVIKSRKSSFQKNNQTLFRTPTRASIYHQKKISFPSLSPMFNTPLNTNDVNKTRILHKNKPIDMQNSAKISYLSALISPQNRRVTIPTQYVHSYQMFNNTKLFNQHNHLRSNVYHPNHDFKIENKIVYSNNRQFIHQHFPSKKPTQISMRHYH